MEVALYPMYLPMIQYNCNPKKLSFLSDKWYSRLQGTFGVSARHISLLYPAVRAVIA